MSTREKIIVGIMCVAILFGVYIFFFSSTSDTGGGKPSGKAAAGPTVEEVVKKVNATLGEVTVSDADRFVVARAEAEWQSDPFFDRKKDQALARAGELQGPQIKINIKYTGYIAMGRKILAIINGQEYEPGEELPPGGIILKKIEPGQVIVETMVEKQTVAVKIVEEKL